MRRLASVTAAVIAVVGPTATASAGDGDSPYVGATGGGSSNPVIEVGSSEPGAKGSTPSGSGGASGGETPFSACPPGQIFAMTNRGPTCFVPESAPGSAGPVVSAVDLARVARRELPLEFPLVQTSPPRGVETLVGLSTWFWLGGTDAWVPRMETAEVPGLSATVVATPRSVEFSGWDGDVEWSVQCRKEDAVPWDPDASGEQRSDCSHVFVHSSAVEPDGQTWVSAVMWWDVTWTATDGSSGGLPVVYREFEFPLLVAEAQAIVTG